MSEEHAVTQIVQAVADRITPLVGLELSVGPVQSVEISRVWPTDIRDLPAISVYSPDDTASRRPRGQPGTRIERVAARVQILIALPRPATAKNGLEADIGKIRVAIETPLGSDPSLAGEDGEPLIEDFRRDAGGSGPDPYSGQPITLVWLSYSAIARHREGDPTHLLTQA